MGLGARCRGAQLVVVVVIVLAGAAYEWIVPGLSSARTVPPKPEIAIDAPQSSKLSTMSVAKAFYFVRLPDLTRTTGFRWTLVITSAFGVCIPLTFGFVYWQTAAYMTARVDQMLLDHAETLAGAKPEEQPQMIEDYFSRRSRVV